MSAALEILKRGWRRSGHHRACNLFQALALMAVIVVGAATAEGKLVSAASDGTQSANGVNKYSPGITEVLKMVDAGVSKDVIKVYIDNSPVAYRPSADEIIALHEHGVSGEIITALLHRGAEVRTKLAQSTQASQNPPMQPAQPTTGSYAPAANYAPAPQPVYQDYSYAYNYPAYSYGVYPGYSYASPYFYSSFYYYPYFSYRSCYPYYGYRSCYPSYGYRSGYSSYGFRSGYSHFGGFRPVYSSTRFSGGFSSRSGGFHGAYSSGRPSGGFASIHHGGMSAGRRR